MLYTRDISKTEDSEGFKINTRQTPAKIKIGSGSK